MPVFFLSLSGQRRNKVAYRANLDKRVLRYFSRFVGTERIRLDPPYQNSQFYIGDHKGIKFMNA